MLSIRNDTVFKKRFGHTPLARPKRRGLLRNAAIVARNVSATAAVPVLQRCVVGDPDALVRGHALWALAGLDESIARRQAEVSSTDEDAFVRSEARAVLA